MANIVALTKQEATDIAKAVFTSKLPDYPDLNFSEQLYNFKLTDSLFMPIKGAGKPVPAAYRGGLCYYMTYMMNRSPLAYMTKIGSDMFNGFSESELYIPPNILKIRDGGLRGCRFETVYIDSTMAGGITSQAFENCEINNIVIQDSGFNDSNLDIAIFANVEKLMFIELPEGIDTISCSTSLKTKSKFKIKVKRGLLSAINFDGDEQMQAFLKDMTIEG